MLLQVLQSCQQQCSPQSSVAKGRTSSYHADFANSAFAVCICFLRGFSEQRCILCHYRSKNNTRQSTGRIPVGMSVSVPFPSQVSASRYHLLVLEDEYESRGYRWQRAQARRR